MPNSTTLLLGALTVLVLGCRTPSPIIETSEPEGGEPEGSEPEGSEPVANGSLANSEGRVGPDPDASDHREATPVVVGPLGKFVGEPLQTVFDPDGLVVTDYAIGSGPGAQSGDTVRFHYVGVLADGREFDSSHARNQPFAFDLGGGRVIAGLDRGLIGARPGMLRVLSIPPALGYGDRGAGSTIPANATLMFYIEVLAVEPPVTPP